MRLFGNPGRQFALDPAAATRIFRAEFNKALDAMDEESMQAGAYGYEYGNMDTFLDVHEEVYRYLAETNCSGDEVSAEAWRERVPHLDPGPAMLAHQQLSRINAIWHLSLDQTAEAIENEQIDTDIFHMDHAMRLRFEARVAAVREYRQRMSDPRRRFESLLAAPVLQPATTAAPAAVPQSGPIIDSAWAALTAEQAAQKFINDNPKLVASETGKREAKWTDKTKSQFETAMRLLQKSMGSKPFVSLSDEDLRQLLKHFDGLPPTLPHDELTGFAQVTLRFGSEILNIHHPYEIARQWLRDFYVLQHGAPVIAILHAPHLVGSENPVHVHGLVIPRRLTRLGWTRMERDLASDLGQREAFESWSSFKAGWL